MSEKKYAHLVEPGDEFEPLEIIITPEFNQQICYAQEDFDPRYIEARKPGQPWVHPALLFFVSANTRSLSFSLPPNWAEIMAADEAEYLNPASVGKKLRVTWKVIDAYQKRGRPWHVLDILVEDEDGKPIMRRKMTNTFSAPELVSNK